MKAKAAEQRANGKTAGTGTSRVRKKARDVPLDVPASWLKPQPLSELEFLRQRLDRLVVQLGREFPKLPKATLARALVAKACDVSIEAVGPLATVWMTARATDLLGGRWSEESKSIFISTK